MSRPDAQTHPALRPNTGRRSREVYASFGKKARARDFSASNGSPVEAFPGPLVRCPSLVEAEHHLAPRGERNPEMFEWARVSWCAFQQAQKNQVGTDKPATINQAWAIRENRRWRTPSVFLLVGDARCWRLDGRLIKSLATVRRPTKPDVNSRTLFSESEPGRCAPQFLGSATASGGRSSRLSWPRAKTIAMAIVAQPAMASRPPV